MFDILKKKVASFIGGLAGKQEEKLAEPQTPDEKPIQPAPELKEEQKKVEEIAVNEPAAEPTITPLTAPAVQPPVTPTEKPSKPQKTVHAPPAKPVEDKLLPKKQPTIPRQTSPPKQEEQRDIAPRFNILSKVKSLITQEYEITPAEAEPFFDGLQIALLESDVSLDTADHLVEDLKTRIIGKKVRRGNVQNELNAEVRNAFTALFSTDSFNLANFVAAQKASGEPAVLLFVGPNGAGKTTTIAKLAQHLNENGFSSVIAAGDTFRKAAIEQASIHGEKLGVRVVKHGYGADPTAVAFDAVAAAKASKIDVVLIDTAGRQETNYNLVREMQKIERVIKPHLKIFIGEAIAGNSLVEQVKAFHGAIKLDGIILTKMDCDGKGGGSFSVAYETKLPILFMGIGQEYGDLRPFDVDWIVDNVFAA